MEQYLKRHAVNVESPDMKQRRMSRIVNNKVTSFMKATGEQVLRMAATKYFHNFHDGDDFIRLLQSKAIWIQHNLDRALHWESGIPNFGRDGKQIKV